MSRLNLNLKFSWIDVVKHIVRIVLAIVGILLFRKYFPDGILPKDFIFTIAIYMCIYILVSLVVESIFRKFGK